MRPVWTEARVGAELADFLDEIGAVEWPTRDQFRDAGHGGLYKALDRIGGVNAWRQTVGLSADWNEHRIEAKLDAYLTGRPSTRWPTRAEFVRDGRGLLLRAIDRHGAGLRYWFDRLADAQLERRLTRLLDGRATWPTTAEWHRLNALPVLVAVHRHPLGTAGWALRLNLLHPHARARRAPRAEREQGTDDRRPGQSSRGAHAVDAGSIAIAGLLVAAVWLLAANRTKLPPRFGDGDEGPEAPRLDPAGLDQGRKTRPPP